MQSPLTTSLPGIDLIKQSEDFSVVAYLSRYNSDNSLSSYAWIPDHSITDVSFGIGHGRGKWDLNVFIKNVLDDDTVRNRTWNAYAPGFPRLFGITFSSRL